MRYPQFERQSPFHHQIEAAYDLGANLGTILVKIIIPHSMPGIVSGSIVVFMLTLVVSARLKKFDRTLPINLYLQVRDGSTPVINAISFLLIIGTSTAAVANLYFSKKER